MDNSLNTSRLSRRQFGKLAGARRPGRLARRPALVRSALARRRQTWPPIIDGKVSGLVIHNAELGVMETPLTMLRKYNHTQKEILFNRFHSPAPG